ncbi:MAG: hypothetical protein HY848_05060, partial [Betaproteobacteria bacterium]|nr:hypothetical protein [Betaproteobacteria bacterium]
AVRTTPVYLGIIDEQPLRAARANLVFGTDEKRIRTKNKVMQLPRSNYHIRANVFVLLVAASGRAMYGV